ncbi:PilW family protein [Ammoniphilus sp. CFH 90114]|uniref:PilW family protein n=1 Tax=Ammoniphilus sp. CFH 90114 TaxID=2493665 RepID=UPI00100E9F9E|nr:type II secretion system protein [Ammoniphilus sp. CFH 90114]RXT14685.1 type II secretion system protein [Ammoniphilus sp. CFH 90114]
MKKYLKNVNNQNGVTLIELLAATVILFLFIIPLSSFYLSGFTVFQQTVKQTNLRQELDFVIADVMKKIQYANYFELQTTRSDDKNNMIKLINSGKLVSDLTIDSTKQNLYHTDLATYRIEVPSSSTPRSTVTKHTYHFEDFDFNKSSYVVNGLFSLDEEQQLLTTYFIIAPKTAENSDPIIVNQQQASFKDIKEIEEYVKNNQGPFEYIRFVKTEFPVSNSQ